MKKLFTILVLFLVIGCTNKEENSALLDCLETSLKTEKWDAVDGMLIKDDILIYEAVFSNIVLKVQGRYLELSKSENKRLRAAYKEKLKQIDNEVKENVLKKYKCRNS